MNKIHETLDDYKSNYQAIWGKFKSKLPNSLESDFIELEIERYQKYLFNTKIVRRPDGSVYSVESVAQDRVQVKAILDQFYDPQGNYFHEDVCKNLHFGFKSIIDYLQSKIITSTKLSNRSFALLTVVKQELKIILRFQSGMREKELKELCDKEGYKYGSVRNPYMEIDSHGLQKSSDTFSDKHLADIEPYLKDNPEALSFIERLKTN